MGLDIVNNQSALAAEYNMSQSTMAEQNNIAQLSSGYKINKAADDSAGLVISDHLNEEITGYQQASQNAQNAISVVQTADGALNEVTAILNRVYQLANQAANQSAQDSTSTAAAAQEITQSLKDIDQIAQQTQFGSSQLLWTASGAASSTIAFTFQVGWDSGSYSQVTLQITGISSAALSLGSFASASVATNAAATAVMSLVNAALQTIDTERGVLGAAQNQIQHLSNNLGVGLQNLSSAESSYKDTDMASAMVAFTKNQILNQAGVSMLAQANSSSQTVLKLLG
jgi:flagellin